MVYCVEAASWGGMMKHEAVDAVVKADGGGMVHSSLHNLRLALRIVDR